MTAAAEVDIAHTSTGRAVHIRPDGTMYGARGYRIFRSTDDGASWQFVTRMPSGLVRSVVSIARLGARLIRQEVRSLNVLSTGTLVASNREGVFYANVEEPVMRRASVEKGTQPLAPPMCITVGPNDRVLWGEYDSKTAHGKPVRLYVSDDGGRSYSIARVFEGGSILHVHNLRFDAGLRKYWLLAGDHNHEPGIGLLSEDLKDFDWLGKGDQKYRTVDVFDFGDRLVYGMDTEKAANAIVSLDKKSGEVRRIIEIEGSCIYSCRFGGWYVLTTTVEPSAVNKCRDASMWVSRDGENWHRVMTAEKDRWDARYFQYGSLVLPRGDSDRETIFFSGQALAGYDGRLFAAHLKA